MNKHIADALKVPDLVQLDRNLYVLRFESMKLYSTLTAVEQLLSRGTVQAGDTLVDSSSGLYAYALAMACHKHGLACHVVASSATDRSLLVQLEILGATVEQVRGSGHLRQDQDLRVARVQGVLAANPRAHWMRQYHDDIHYSGYAAVASMLRTQLRAGPCVLVGAVGSGCSTGGMTCALRDLDIDTRLVGVQPFGSISFHSENIEDPDAIIAGIGSAIHFDNVRHRLYDDIHWIGFDHACAGAVSLLERHALFAGLSSGCAYLAARW